jgi:hypothetical protein
MTSYEQPNYDVSLRMSITDFSTIAGIAFDVMITFNDDQEQFSGMLIVPQGNDFPESSLPCPVILMGFSGAFFANAV